MAERMILRNINPEGQRSWKGKLSGALPLIEVQVGRGCLSALLILL